MIKGFRKFVSRFIRKGPKPLAADDQTRLSWAFVAETYADLPDVYRSFFDALQVREGKPFPYAVITPTFKGFLHPEREKLICRVEENIYILEAVNHRLFAIGYPLKDICYIETGSILLSSWLTLTGRDLRGGMHFTTLKFNSITEHMFTPFVNDFRAVVTGASAEAEPDSEQPVFDFLAEDNFKFMNYARKSIRPGETVVQVLHQPELRRDIARILGLSLSRQITPAHLAILTDSELILIRDDESQSWIRHKAHGGIWDFIPLKQIVSISHVEKRENLLALSIELPEGMHLEAMYQADQKADLERLCRRVKTGGY